MNLTILFDVRLSKNGKINLDTREEFNGIEEEAKDATKRIG